MPARKKSPPKEVWLYFGQGHLARLLDRALIDTSHEMPVFVGTPCKENQGIDKWVQYAPVLPEREGKGRVDGARCLKCGTRWDGPAVTLRDVHDTSCGGRVVRGARPKRKPFFCGDCGAREPKRCPHERPKRKGAKRPPKSVIQSRDLCVCGHMEGEHYMTAGPSPCCATTDSGKCLCGSFKPRPRKGGKRG